MKKLPSRFEGLLFEDEEPKVEREPCCNPIAHVHEHHCPKGRLLRAGLNSTETVTVNGVLRDFAGLS